MLLMQIKQYIQTQGSVSLAELSTQFDIDAELLRDMLQLWINKGKLIERKKTSSCGDSCTQCPSASVQIYEWVDG